MSSKEFSGFAPFSYKLILGLNLEELMKKVLLPVCRLETARPGVEDNGISAVLGGNKHSVQMDDGDGYFDLDNWEYGSEFGAPIDHSSG